jgi:Tol biopolymer transport system component
MDRWRGGLGGMALILLLLAALPAAGQTGEPVTCPGAPESRLIVGERGRVTPGSPNRMRDQPTTAGADVGSIPGGARFHVLDGPVCADGYAWWQVDYAGVVGWTVEGAGNDYWVEPVLPADILFVSEGNGWSHLVTIDAAGGHLHDLGDVGEAAYQTLPAIAPDGSRIAFTGIRPDGSEYLGVMGVDGRDHQVLAEGGPDYVVLSSAWSPDSTQIVFAADPDRAGGSPANLFIVAADGGAVQALTASDTVDHASPVWSPDGTQIVFVANPDGTTANLFSITPADGTLRQLTANPYTVGKPRWSPDGSAIGFEAFVPGGQGPHTTQGFVVNADGSGERQPTGAGLNSYAMAWSPDGARLLFLAVREDGQPAELYTVNTDGSDRVRLTENAITERDPTWSADGTRIVFSALPTADDTDSYATELYLVDADGQNVQRLTDNDTRDVQAVWIP